MSWFSLIQAEKNVLDSQSFYESAFTGQFIGSCVVDNFLNKSETYVKIREAVATFFIKKFCPHLHSTSTIISRKLLLKIVHGTNLQRLFPEIAKKAILTKLEPFSNKVIKKSIKIFIQKEIADAFDSLWGQGISVGIITSIYHIASRNLSSPQFDNYSSLNHVIGFAQKYLPTPSTLLSALTALHVAKMIYIVWKTQRLKFEKTDSNKQEVKRMIINQTKNPIKTVLQEKRSYKALQVAFNDEKIDAFISFLINELIDHYYWNDLHEFRFLNLPLVT